MYNTTANNIARNITLYIRRVDGRCNSRYSGKTFG